MLFQEIIISRLITGVQWLRKSSGDLIAGVQWPPDILRAVRDFMP